MAKLRNRYILWLALALLLVLGLAYAFWPRPILVELAEIERGPMSVTIDEEGEARFRDVFVISAPIAGDVGRIELEAGDQVMAGETVASFHPSDPTLLDARSKAEREAAVRAAEAAVALAQAELERPVAELDFAKSDLARAQKLKPGDTISTRELQRSKIEVKARTAETDAARATLDVRRSELDSARAGLIETSPRKDATPSFLDLEIRSPVSGRVLRVIRESEGVVLAGEPLVEIGRSDGIEVVADLLSTDAVRVKEGLPVSIGDWGGETELAGHVRRVEPYANTKISALGIEEQRVNVLIDFDKPEEALSRLGHGYRVEARIVIWSKRDAIKAPLGALFRDGDKWACFVVVKDRARLRRIEIGHRNSITAEILSGLKSGERVILHPPDRIKDGGFVRQRPDA